MLKKIILFLLPSLILAVDTELIYDKNDNPIFEFDLN